MGRRLVYLPKGPLRGPGGPDDCCAELRAELAAADGFEPIYDGPGATILAWTAPSAGDALPFSARVRWA